MLNHSCRPNTLTLLIGQQLLLKAVRDIGPGEQLFISYHETLRLHSERQAKLHSSFNFTCACERCLEDISKSPVSVFNIITTTFSFVSIIIIGMF